MLGDIAEQENRVRGVQQSIDESLGRMAEIDHELTTVREELTANSNMVEGCRMKLGGRESSVAQLSDRVNKISVEARSMDSRIAMLSEMEKDYEGYSKAVKTVMREGGAREPQGRACAGGKPHPRGGRICPRYRDGTRRGGTEHRRRYAERRPPVQ